MVLLDTSNGKVLGELDPSSFESGELNFERRMNIEANECRVDSSDKGLSSVLIDKNKLVII